MSGPRSLLARTIAIAVIALMAIVIGGPTLSASGPGNALAVLGATDTSSQVKGITVQGTGRITLSPDLATISVGVQTQAPRAAQAQAQASAVMSRIIAAVKGGDIADADLTTQWISLQPLYAYGPLGSVPPRVTGYEASQSLSIKVHHVATAGAVIDAAVGAGATQVGGISFTVADPTAATAQARAAAMLDAQQHAAALAHAAGVSLGSLISVTEVAAPMPGPIAYAAGSLAVPDARTPVQVGTSDIEVMVEATFAIGS
jgi:uncharacterized protein